MDDVEYGGKGLFGRLTGTAVACSCGCEATLSGAQDSRLGYVNRMGYTIYCSILLVDHLGISSRVPIAETLKHCAALSGTGVVIVIVVKRTDGVQRKIRTHLDLLSIPRLWGKKCQNVLGGIKRLQIQNLS